MLKYADYDIVFQEIPDEVTLAVNLSLCPNGCPGCHSPQLQGDVGEELTREALRGLVERYAQDITCLCFMGGDGDPQAIEALARFVRGAWPALRIGWYSGRPELPEGIAAERFDYLKLGPYVAACGPLRAPTTNQRLWRIRADGTREDLTPRFWRQ